MPIQTVETRRLYRQIADQLRALIVAGEFEVGARLPSERDLAVQFGVSRPSVREALIALELEGMVEIRAGSGVHVVARESAPVHAAESATANAFGPLEIIRARQLVEGELAAVAAARSTPALVNGLRESLDLMRHQIERGEIPIHGDRLFHLRVVECADNAPMLQIVTNLFDERNSPLFEQLGMHFESAPSWRAALAEHEAVVSAIAAGDPAAARDAMQQHLGNSHDRFTAAWPQLRGAAPVTASAVKRKHTSTPARANTTNATTTVTAAVDELTPGVRAR